MLSKLTCLSRTLLTFSRISNSRVLLCIQKNPQNFSSRWYSTGQQPFKGQKDSGANRDSMYYVVSIGVVFLGLSFAAIPAYRIFCEATSFGGTTQVAKDFDKIENMSKVEDRLIKVQFNADVPSSMRWHFKPLQDEIYVHPGETALAFYTGMVFKVVL